MTRLDDDPSSNVGQASKSLTSGVGQDDTRRVPEPASAVFQGRTLQVLKEALLHFNRNPREEDWVQFLEEIEIKTKKVDWGEFYGSFYPVVTQGIEVGMMGGQPIYAILGGHGSPTKTGEDLHGCLECIVSSTARPPCVPIKFHLIMDSIRTKSEANPNIQLHKFASMFECDRDLNYWFIMLVVKEGLLSDERLRELREQHGLSTYLLDLLDVKAKWNTRKGSNEKAQPLPSKTDPRASSTAPPTSPAKSNPQQEDRTRSLQQIPPIPLPSTVESKLHTATAMKRTSRKAPIIKSKEQYTNLIDQFEKEEEDAANEMGVAERLVVYYRHQLAYAEAKKASSQQRILHAQHDRKKTIERTSRELAQDLLISYENLDELEEDDRTAKRRRTS